MKQGEIWMSDLNPVIGSEQSGRMPVVILSGNLMNRFLQVIITAPLTSKIKNYQGNPVIDPTSTNNLKHQSEVLVFHLRSISKDRLVERIGEITKTELDQALETLKDLTTL